MLNKLLFVVVFFLTISKLALSSVWVYPSPGEKFKSNVFELTVKQADLSFQSFVFEDQNNDNTKDMTDFNHWSTFSFSDEVTVEIKIKTSKKLNKCFVHPYALGIEPTIIGDVISFKIAKPCKLFVRMQFEGDVDSLETRKNQGSFGYENPLFIFADGAEINAPEKTDSNVQFISLGKSQTEIKEIIDNAEKKIIYFEPGGVHQLGEKFEVKSDQDFYIPGGAYVIGNFVGKDVSNVTIRGRGIVSLLGYPRYGGVQSMGWNLVNFEGKGTRQLVDGITFTNAAHFNVLSRGEMELKNCKMFSWYLQTDGFGGGDGSAVYDCFMKVNDDNVKLYNSNTTVNNLVVYHQKNGAIFQFGWGPSSGLAENINVKNIYVVQDEAYAKDRSLIEFKSNKGKEIRNFCFENIYVDQDLWKIASINNESGTVKNFDITNLFINKGVRSISELKCVEGVISSFKFCNCWISGMPIKNMYDGTISTSGNVTKIKFGSKFNNYPSFYNR